MTTAPEPRQPEVSITWAAPRCHLCGQPMAEVYEPDKRYGPAGLEDIHYFHTECYAKYQEEQRENQA